MRLNELIVSIKIRPKHFLEHYSFQEFSTFFRGYRARCKEDNFDNDEFDFFIVWLKKRFNPIDHPNWKMYFAHHSDENALTHFFEVWEEFYTDHLHT